LLAFEVLRYFEWVVNVENEASGGDRNLFEQQASNYAPEFVTFAGISGSERDVKGIM